MMKLQPNENNVGRVGDSLALGGTGPPLPRLGGAQMSGPLPQHIIKKAKQRHRPSQLQSSQISQQLMTGLGV